MLGSKVAPAFLLPLLATLIACGAGGASADASTTIRMEPGGSGRTFEGIGAVSAGASSRLLLDYPRRERAEVLDYLFRPRYGASLQLLKVEIGGDTDSTDGSEASHMRVRGRVSCTRGYEWWLMKQAKRRNPAIKLAGLAWGAPGWLRGGFWSQDNISYTLAWLRCARRQGLRIDYVGGWNERGLDAGWFVRFKRALRKEFPRVRLVADDAFGSWQRVVQALYQDLAFRQSVDVVGTHYTKGSSPPAAQALGKPLWSSEDGPWSSTWNAIGLAGLPLQELLNRNYVGGRITSTLLWSPVSSYYEVLPLPDSGLMVARTPWSGAYETRPPLWIVAHTTQFAKPGWRYVDRGSGELVDGGSFVTLAAPGGGAVSTVIETTRARGAQTVMLELPRRLCGRRIGVWRTTADSWFRFLGRRRAAACRLELELRPDAVYSVTTTTGQRHGRARGRRQHPFPLPYRTSFDRARLGHQPRYLSQLEGAFEVRRCGGGRTGRCVRQEVAQTPIRWTGDLRPAAVAGAASWRDYRVSARVRLIGAGAAGLLGRVSALTYAHLNAYRLELGFDGSWRLLRDNNGASTPIAAGRVARPGRRWHRLELAFAGTTITAVVDGRRVARVADVTFAGGLAGLGSDFQPAEFDDFSVTPVPSRP